MFVLFSNCVQISPLRKSGTVIPRTNISVFLGKLEISSSLMGSPTQEPPSMQVQAGAPRALSSSGRQTFLLGPTFPCLTDVARVYLFGKIGEATVRIETKFLI